MYESFAFVYDELMEDVPYQKWEERIRELLCEQGIRDGLVLDLGCGTGSMTTLLSRDGYDMIGVDASEQMLQVALEKARREDLDILYLLQDMREFELYGTVRAVVSVCDSLNYVLGEDELLGVFRLVSNYLDPGGLFLFDMSTSRKYSEQLGDQTFAWSGEDCAYIWENTWYPEEGINEYDLTLFIREGELYRRRHEVHIQRAYDLDTVKRLLEEAGLELMAVYDGYTKDEPNPRSQRLLFMARETMKSVSGTVPATTR